MRKKSLIIFFLIASIIASMIGFSVSAATITPDSTPCNSYTELYLDGSTVKLTEWCLIRSCLAENRSASFYFKYSKTNKEKMTVSLIDYASATLQWSTGVKKSFDLNQTGFVDVDGNGFYDQKVLYEIQKPEISQACFRIYELKEGKQYKVDTSNSVSNPVITNGVVSSVTNASVTNATGNAINGSANSSAQTTSNSTLTSESTSESTNESAESENGLVLANTQTAPQTAEQTKQENVVLGSGSPQEKTQEKTQASSTQTFLSKKTIVGITISVIIVALILVGFFIYEKKRKNAFVVKINEEIGKIDIDRKEEKKNDKELKI